MSACTSAWIAPRETGLKLPLHRNILVVVLGKRNGQMKVTWRSWGQIEECGGLTPVPPAIKVGFTWRSAGVWSQYTLQQSEHWRARTNSYHHRCRQHHHFICIDNFHRYTIMYHRRRRPHRRRHRCRRWSSSSSSSSLSSMSSSSSSSSSLPSSSSSSPSSSSLLFLSRHLHYVKIQK